MKLGFVAVCTLVCAVAATLTSCGGGAISCTDGSDHFVQYELYLGRDGPDGEVVTDEAWSEFLAESVTPLFPEGLTVLDAAGQWRNAEGTVERERSKLLVILAAPGDPAANAIARIADSYKHRFDQESVLTAAAHTCVTFS